MAESAPLTSTPAFVDGGAALSVPTLFMPRTYRALLSTDTSDDTNGVPLEVGQPIIVPAGLRVRAWTPGGVDEGGTIFSMPFGG